MSERARAPLLLALAFAFAVMLAGCRAAPGREAAPQRRAPNIVLVFADDLGYGELGCYGQQKIATPNIDRLAREGARLTQFYTAAPVCAPSRSALLTGQHLGHTPIRDNSEVQPEGQGPLPAETRTLAHDLRAAGYATACIGKWGLGFVGSSGDPNAMGFDLFYGYNCQRQAHNFYPTHLWRNDERVVLEGNDPKSRTELVYAPDLMLDEAKAFIGANASRPFFLLYASPLPHLALQPTRKDLEPYDLSFDETPYAGGKGYLPHQTPRAAYAAMISRLDAEVGAIRAELERHGLAENTLIVVTSDNGPTHDVGGVDTVFFDSTAGLRGRKGSVWEGGIRVPCVAWWPRTIAPGVTIDDAAWTADLRATFGAFADAPAPPSDGRDLSALLLDGDPLPTRALYWPFPGYGGQEAVREGDWKIVRTGLRQRKSPAAENEGWQLFNLATDPNETTDVAAAHPEIVSRLAEIAQHSYTPSARFPLR
ncbi:MAG: sulfatase-like hydrolase/transferase [Phycisphaera sp.]|nr:sulfatase-like hydrolase/transferase [Phycisphaera sp.]